MARIVPKLNLNKTPQLVDNNSLVFAKNIRLLKDGTIGPDTSLEEVETNVGDLIHEVIYHEEESEVQTNTYFSILDYQNTINVYKNNPLTSNPEFIFSNDDVNDEFDDQYQNSDRSFYSEVSSNVEPNIFCYKMSAPSTFVWTNADFTYNETYNQLIEQNGNVLFIGIRKEIYDGVAVEDLKAPLFFYFIGKKNLEGITIVNAFSNGANYIALNPVYKTVREETIIISPSYIEEVDTYETLKYIAHIVGLDNKVYFFKECNYIKDSPEARAAIKHQADPTIPGDHDEYPNAHFDDEEYEGEDPIEFSVNSDGYVTRNGAIFADSSVARRLFPNFNDRVRIFEYDEVDNAFRLVECCWHYSGGEINGCVSVNGTGEYILTICEYDAGDNLLVPIKHININRCQANDDESFYTQAPNIPISNLKLSGRYVKNIPAGVYQFFIRYKIHEGFYTNWFPCSKELFAGSRKIVDTLQGSLKHTDLHEDSNNSFVFTIDHLYPEFCSNYEQFQLGFIISSDGGVFARSWRHFDMTLASSVSIYFDYDKTDIEEINIDDLLKVNYNIFNIKNIAQYKNKLYIANYIESDFNEPSLQTYANSVIVSFDSHKLVLDTGYYLNNIPLSEAIGGIYTSFGNIPINTTYYDKLYCDISKENIDESYETLELGVYAAHALDENGNHYNPNFPESLNPEIVKVYTEYGTDTVYDIINYDPAIEIENENHDTLIDTVIDAVKELVLGIDSNGVFKIDIEGTPVDISSFVIEYNTYGPVETNNTTIETSYNGHDVEIQAIQYTRKKYTKKLQVNVSLKHSLLTTDYVYNEYNTFLPFTKYDFYIHYVKQNGIVTNGYYIGTKEVTQYTSMYKEVELANVPPEIINAAIQGLDTITLITDINQIGDLTWYNDNIKEWGWYMDGTHNGRYFKREAIDDENSIIVPQFSNIICPEGYVGCFISYTKYGNNVSQGYNYEAVFNATDNVTVHRLDCLDLNCLLYNINNNIQIKTSDGETITRIANYYASGTTNPLEYLGGSGHIEFTTLGDSAIDSTCWIITDSVGKSYNKRLIKLTPFIKLDTENTVTYFNLTDLNGPGYYCEVVTLVRERCLGVNGYYVSGSDIYKRTDDVDPFDLDLDDNRVDYHYSTKRYIFSNYNLNYVSLTSDLTPIIRRYNVSRENNAEEGTIEESHKQFITVVNSLLASYSLELKSFYKDYTRKLYQEYTKNNIIKFDNTIRVSSIDVDELYRYIYKFEATDYYNVPSHRGIITNLVSIANGLYVHCEHSLFKFADNKTLNAQEEEVTLQENDIFNSGISEVFDAQFGYGGLKDRKQSLITYNAYVFYDDVANVIYAFGGEQQIANIGETIQKIIDFVKPTDVRFVGDELDDRFFVNLRNSQGNVCLSFNFKSKSFIAIHDIDFKTGFHTRRHTYFVHDNYVEDTLTGWSIYRLTDKLTVNDADNFIVYQNCYTPSLISINDMPVPTGLNIATACIDVITNVEYEKIKALNYINWICSEILNYGDELNFTAEEELNRLYPGDKVRIYSDSTSTQLIELVDSNGKAKLSKEQRNITPSGNIDAVKESWQYPTYNCGVFSMNYFRDIITNGNVYTAPNPDLFRYKDAPNIGPNGLVDLTKYVQRQNLTQESSIIYGKYFVLRLIFNNRNFKIENVTFRMSDYGKTK